MQLMIIESECQHDGELFPKTWVVTKKRLETIECKICGHEIRVEAWATRHLTAFSCVGHVRNGNVSGKIPLLMEVMGESVMFVKIKEEE